MSVYENDVGENSAPYLVTELVEGETLAGLFRHWQHRSETA